VTPELPVTRIRWTLLLVSLAGMVLPVPAAARPAAPQVVAAHNLHFVPEEVTVERGGTLEFFHCDWAARLEFDGPTLTERRSDGLPPRFGSGLVTFPTAAEVKGVSSLPAGRYAFRCEIHPFMRGTLVIT
jgi:plastocyanin